MITLTKANNGQSIEVKIGDVIRIQLDENPTTGYRWKEEPGDPGILELTQSDFERESGAAVGGGGQHVFTYKALKAGAATIRMKHWREWEGDRSITANFTVTIKVNG